MSARILVATLAPASLVLTLSCMEMRSSAPSRQEEANQHDVSASPGAPPPSEAEAGPSGGAAAPMLSKSAPAPSPLGEADGAIYGLRGGEVDGRLALADAPADAPEPAATRSWFPESFLWVPVVETGAEGRAVVPFTVPDSLTTWRVLALAASRDGAQAGTEASFLSTLPAYVDMVVPGSFYAGDEVALPVQVVNTTSGALSEPLSVSMTGATGGGAGQLLVGAGGSASRTVSTTLGGPGVATFTATFGNIDTVVREVPVRPVGEPKLEVRAGSMASDRELAFPGIPGGEHGQLSVTAWPGALSMVRAELAGGGGQESPWARSGADLPRQVYRLALATAAAGLPEEDASPDAVRTLRLRAWQPVSRAGRAPDIATACLLAEGLRAAPEGSIDADLRERMRELVAEQQAPDGTWVSGGGTIDQALVLTALCTRAVDSEPVRLRAEGAFARHLPRLADPYLAAWALASGAVTDADLEARLRDTLLAGLATGADGNRQLRPGGAPRHDGTAATLAYATAVAALALAANPAEAAELATSLVGQHRATGGPGAGCCWPSGGWGDGLTDLLALRALEGSFRGELPATVTLVVEADGVEVARGTLDASQPHRAATLVAPVGAGAHAVRVRAEPAAPGIVFSATHLAYVPWAPPEGAAVQVAVTPPAGLRAGAGGAVRVRVASPSTTPVDLVLGLPAGVRADEAALELLVNAGRLVSFTAAEGSVTLRGVAGGGWEADVPVTASLAGRLWSAPSTALSPGTGTTLYVLPPSRWRVGG